MIDFPNAKINIGLNITDKRPDGFHNIETIFYPISLSDILEVQILAEAGKTEVINTGIAIDAPSEKNLTYQAFRALQQMHFIPEIKLHLHKIIPFGSGLGGGSSDAAFTLTLLNKLFSLELQEDQLKRHAEKLGADCAFFLNNTPQYAFEKGDQMIATNFSLKGYYLLLVVPNISISTKFAYQGVSPQKSTASLKQNIEELKVESWKNYIKNDFEEHIFSHYPELKMIKEQLYNAGALYASLSGSGSSIYGIFKSKPPAVDFPASCFVWQEKLQY